MSRAGLVDHYLEKSKEPDFEIDLIRKELSSNNVDEEEIRAIVRVVDSDIQRRELTKSTRNKSKELIGIGALLTFVGVGITAGTYMGLIPSGNSFLIVYGPFIGGVSLMLGGWIESRR